MLLENDWVINYSVMTWQMRAAMEDWMLLFVVSRPQLTCADIFSRQFTSIFTKAFTLVQGDSKL